MVQLDCWLPEKEMFGIFPVDSVALKKDGLCVVVSNEVFQFTLQFPAAPKACLVRETRLIPGRFDGLCDNQLLLMRNNTFFKLKNDPLFEAVAGEQDIHYVVAAPNYTVEILSGHAPSVALDMAPGRRPGGGL